MNKKKNGRSARRVCSYAAPRKRLASPRGRLDESDHAPPHDSRKGRAHLGWKPNHTLPSKSGFPIRKKTLTHGLAHGSLPKERAIEHLHGITCVRPSHLDRLALAATPAGRVSIDFIGTCMRITFATRVGQMSWDASRG